jgi:prophage regulatory protein
MTDPHSAPERLLRVPAVLERIGLRRTCLYRHIASGEFPRPVKLGRASAWPESEVRAWIAARKAERGWGRASEIAPERKE